MIIDRGMLGERCPGFENDRAAGNESTTGTELVIVHAHEVGGIIEFYSRGLLREGHKRLDRWRVNRRHCVKRLPRLQSDGDRL